MKNKNKYIRTLRNKKILPPKGTRTRARHDRKKRREEKKKQRKEFNL